MENGANVASLRNTIADKLDMERTIVSIACSTSNSSSVSPVAVAVVVVAVVAVVAVVGTDLGSGTDSDEGVVDGIATAASAVGLGLVSLACIPIGLGIQHRLPLCVSAL